MKHLKKSSRFFFITFTLLSCALAGCSLAPTYQRPAMNIPNSYKESSGKTSGPWVVAKPESAALDRGPWWQMYNDPILNNLEEKVVCANQNLQAAIARYDEARAEVGVATAGYFPTVTGVGNAFREQASRNTANPPNNPLFSDNLLAADFTYELDVWGQVRNTVAAAKSQARASAADMALIDLSEHAEVATDYFSLRGDDAKQRVLDATVVAYQRSLGLTQNRYKGGASSAEDVDQAQNQLETAKTLAEDMRLKRAQIEHAIAVLVGQTPETFSLAPITYTNTLVTIAPDLPSTLLERRPDIAEAEAQVQAANYNIGVARAAFFPAFNLSTAIGFESAALDSLFKSSSLVWALGFTVASSILNNGAPLVTQTLFDGGKLISLSKLAQATYCETVAKYRQTVLTAYREVEDSLIALRQLDSENRTQTAASAAANRALTQAMYRYKGGLTTYLDVVVVQTTALQAELASIDIHTRRQVASVQLIKALGGGWKNCACCG